MQLSRAGGGTGVNIGDFMPFKGGMLLSSGLAGDVGFWFASGSGTPQPLLHVARSDPEYYGGVTDASQIIVAGDIAYLAYRSKGAFELMVVPAPIMPPFIMPPLIIGLDWPLQNAVGQSEGPSEPPTRATSTNTRPVTPIHRSFIAFTSWLRAAFRWPAHILRG